ncbi:hypothetical protein Zmor_002443 [Zophobas morio]|uniref:Gustatory receptor n=1 Tax=Zophobas morio TaxID=2755281 RepID=A0AA38J0I9_9CUCU|nr:hypothetical protein Zmor_002443 [Zophobas morio]
MFWQPRNLYEYAIPTLALWKFTGLPTFKIDKTTYKVTTTPTSFLCCVAICLLSSNFFVYIKFYGFENTIKSMITVYEFASILTQNVGFVCTAYLRKDKMAILFTKLYLSDTRIRQFCSNKFGYADISWHFILAAAIKISSPVLAGVVDLKFMIAEPKDYAFRYCLYSGCIYYVVSDLTTFFYLTSVKKLYSELEKKLQQQQQQQQFVSRSELHEIVEIHNLLRNLAQSVSNEMQSFLLIKFLNDFFLVASDVFFGTSATIYMSDSFGSALAMTTAISGWMLLISHSIITTTYLFDKISEQDLLTSELIKDIAKNVSNNVTKLYKFEEIFSLNMKVNHLKFTLFGFLPLNCTVVYSMVAGVTTYIIYLVQFSQVEHSSQ